MLLVEDDTDFVLESFKFSRDVWTMLPLRDCRRGRELVESELTGGELLDIYEFGVCEIWEFGAGFFKLRHKDGGAQ
jgi:hypothetical protein